MSLKLARVLPKQNFMRDKLNLKTTYATNGKDILSYQHGDRSGKGLVSDFMSPDELWEKTFPKGQVSDIAESWREKFSAIPNEGCFW